MAETLTIGCARRTNGFSVEFLSKSREVLSGLTPAGDVHEPERK